MECLKSVHEITIFFLNNKDFCCTINFFTIKILSIYTGSKVTIQHRVHDIFFDNLLIFDKSRKTEPERHKTYTSCKIGSFSLQFLVGHFSSSRFFLLPLTMQDIL